MLNGLDLFSGIGGVTLGLSSWVKPIAYCERDRYCQAVLMSRMSNGELPTAPIWDDITTLDVSMLPSELDIIYGGFPCQDISAAGAGAGLGGERSGLFQHVARIVEEANPRFVFLENVPAIRTRGLNGVAQTFTELGYDCRWTIVSAAEVGARHLRKRWFLLAHSNVNTPREPLRIVSSKGQSFLPAIREKSSPDFRHDRKTLADAQGVGRLEGDEDNRRSSQTSTNEKRRCRYSDSSSAEWRRGWGSEPDVGRMADGVPNRVDRIRGLGNAVVPTQARKAFEKLIGIGV